MTTHNGFSTTRIILDQQGNGERTEYMRRWIFSTPLFTVRLHCIKESDYGPPHNHPWNFVSVILKGRYTEELYQVSIGAVPIQLRKMLRRKAFCPVFRRTTAIHKVLLEPGENVWTLCITDGARKRNGVARWGFWTLNGYVPWQVYDPNATEEV